MSSPEQFEPLSIGQLKSGYTPKQATKKAKLVEGKVQPKNVGEDEYKVRAKGCSGNMVYLWQDARVEKNFDTRGKLKKRQGHCVVCATRTSWFCLDCHSFLCTNPDTKTKEGAEEQQYFVIELGEGEEGQFFTKKTCALQWHRHGLEQARKDAEDV